VASLLGTALGKHRIMFVSNLYAGGHKREVERDLRAQDDDSGK
jgi:hypothetical protein